MNIAKFISLAANDSTSRMTVGRLGEYPNAKFNGWIDEFRFSKGIARWTSDFEPPTVEYVYAVTPTPVPTTVTRVVAELTNV